MSTLEGDSSFSVSRSPTTVFVTLPVYNEVRVLRASVERILLVLNGAGINYTLSIAEDGSTDGSKELIQEVIAANPDIVLQSDADKRGRGWALRKLWAGQVADFYAFSDTDFAADPTFLIDAVRKAQGGYDVVIGSRYVPGADVVRPPARDIVSRCYNLLIRFVFADRVHDHQCGLKVFSRRALELLLPLTKEDSWFWDTEVLVLAHDLGFVPLEIPVKWVERKARRTHLFRLLSDFYLHGVGILRLSGRRPSRKVLPGAQYISQVARTDSISAKSAGGGGR
jgi:glycosyltransferase involved in cell wall biosynthesis